MSTALDALPLSPFQQALERGGGEGYEEAVASSPAKCSRIATFRNSQIKFGLKSLHLFNAVHGGFLQNFEGIKVQTPTGKEEPAGNFFFVFAFALSLPSSLEREKKFD